MVSHDTVFNGAGTAGVRRNHAADLRAFIAGVYWEEKSALAL
jgi:hypothetical protein